MDHPPPHPSDQRELVSATLLQATYGFCEFLDGPLHRPPTPGEDRQVLLAAASSLLLCRNDS